MCISAGAAVSALAPYIYSTRSMCAKAHVIGIDRKQVILIQVMALYTFPPIELMLCLYSIYQQWRIVDKTAWC